jgi:hypothetical protein
MEEEGMTRNEAFERLGAAIYAAVLNSPLVDEAVEAFAEVDLRVYSLALSMHIGTEPAASASGVIEHHGVPPFSDENFLRSLRIAPDLKPQERSIE